jgi:hypothetical protein
MNTAYAGDRAFRSWWATSHHRLSIDTIDLTKLAAQLLISPPLWRGSQAKVILNGREHFEQQLTELSKFRPQVHLARMQPVSQVVI